MKVLIVGCGVSGRSAFDFLKRQNVEVEFAKEDDINAKALNEKYLDRLFEGLSFIVTSPGVSRDILFLKEAKKRKIKIVGEFELGTKNIDASMIAITGTNGKTTTVSLINYLLKDYQKGKVYCGGNIGVPVSSFACLIKKEDVCVLECSSFQLEKIKNFAPHISAVLNISPDHLNRHKTMKNYIVCKQNIAKKQTENDYLLINADDEILMQNIPKTKAQILYFSTQKKVIGCYVKHGCIYFNDNLFEKKLVSLKNLKLVGNHNLSNVLCAVLAVYLQTKNLEILKNISEFQGVEHRLEYVKNINGVLFYNDSKATNIGSVLVAAKSFKNEICLILGGSDKGYNFDELFKNMPKNVKNIAIFGQTKQKIAFSAEKFGFKNFYLCDTLKSATLLCYTLAKPKQVVLLSPACASFDQFSNYKERGNFFKKIVKEIDENENNFFDENQTKKN